MSEQKLVPELRFPEFEGDWEGKRGAQLFKSRRERGDDSLPIYSVTQGNGLVPRDSLDRKMEADAASEQNLKVCPNDIVYNMMRMWQGATGLSNTDCMVSPAYIVLKATNLASPSFFNYMFKRSRPLYDLWAYSYGLTNDRLRLYYKDFARIPFHVPKSNEQQKIADFLSSVDAKLDKLNRKKALLEDYKRGLMQQIFSQKLRFKQDDGSEFPEWEEKSLSQLGYFKSGIGFPENEQGGAEGVPFYKVSDMNTPVNSRSMNVANNYVDFNQIKKLKLSPINERSYIFAKVGAAIFLERKRKAEGFCIDNNMMAFIPNKHFNYEFCGFVLATTRLSKYAQVGALPAYNASDLKTIKVFIPHKKEQQKIADFLSSFDQKIDVVSKQIEQLEAFKKGLLQKLFV